MNNTKSGKRCKIRIGSYISAVIAVLAIWGITQTVKTASYERQLSVAQQRAVSSLAEYIDTIETDLRKLQYVSTDTMTSGLSVSLIKATSGAKTCLSQLTAGETRLYAVNKFLSQAGDYSQSLSRRLRSGETMTDEDREQIESLYGYAASLSETVSYMEEVMYAGSMSFEDAVSTLGMLSASQADALSYSDAMTGAEESFSDYPTLLYDGPFADNIASKESELLKNEDEISDAEARRRASAYSGIEESRLIRQEDENSNITAYVFYCEGTSVAVTKKGGYLLYLLSDKYAGEAKLSVSEAIEKGRQYLEKVGFTSLKDSYYAQNDGICTINFAYTMGDVICYTDLIKVSVALDNGAIVSADATAYLMNHSSRQAPVATVSREEAQSKLSSALTATKCTMAIIPTDSKGELFAYEFLCEDKDGNDVLVYIDAETGLEAEIMLLLYSDGGILTR